MVSFLADPKETRGFRTQAALETWLRAERGA